MTYNPQQIEKKWQKAWEKSGIYKTSDKVKGKKNFYHLVMLPYTSGNLHIGHWYNFGPADIYARFKRMQGYNVLSPMGFDAFGLPAENAAIKQNIHPRLWTNNNIKKMREQLKSIGACYDWSREIITSQPDYYRWTQWLFLQLYRAGLAYRARVPANWCPSCKTILANEQVIEGRCERCDAEVFQKETEQWLFKITAFARELLNDLENLDWPERTKAMQRNWIGKSEGEEVLFSVKCQMPTHRSPKAEAGSNVKTKSQMSNVIKVFTTRIDTIFGATYLVLSPEHPIIETLKTDITNYQEIKDYIEQSRKKTERERLSEVKEKTGIEIKGIKALNPANNKEIPIWVADYVLISYGTGAVMAVPAHDKRDWEFAKLHNIKFCEKDVVVLPEGGSIPFEVQEAGQDEIKKYQIAHILNKESFCEYGYLINSDKFSGTKSSKAIGNITSWLAQKKLAKKVVNYKLRDWIISRQRYWGAPIPMIFCQKCGWQAVKEQDLPVLLPRLRDFRPTPEGRSPLARSKKFVKAKCPTCQSQAQRETETMDTFVCSSWYFLRYLDHKNKKQFASAEKIKKWLPVKMYVGGVEHTVMHLLYARFLTKVLKKLGWLNFSEPFLRLRHQGIILGPDGQKMSKSRGNVVDPDLEVAKYGADAVRMYLCFMGPYEQGGPWQPKGIVGISRFLQKVWDLMAKNPKLDPLDQNSKLKKLLHKTIKKVSEDIENFRFNTAISALMVLVNQMQKQSQLSIINCQLLLKLLAPFAPHLAEELWQKIKKQKNSKTRVLARKVEKKFNLRNSIHGQDWPKYDPKLVKEEFITLIIQINGKVRDKIEVETGLSGEEAEKLARQREKIQKYIKGKTIKKIIFVPTRLINFVI